MAQRPYGKLGFPGLLENEDEVIRGRCPVCGRSRVAGFELERMQAEALRHLLRIFGDRGFTGVEESTLTERVDHRSAEITAAHEPVLILVGQ